MPNEKREKKMRFVRTCVVLHSFVLYIYRFENTFFVLLPRFFHMAISQLTRRSIKYR